MNLKEIPVTELKPGQHFKQSIRQRYFRFAAMVIDWKPGDTVFLRGKRLIIQQDCKQILIPIESTIFIPS